METKSLHPKYSVIIPIFNAEKTLRRCLDSLRSKTCDGTEMELILVNDGSNDECLSICTEYSHIFSDCRVINTPNRGVSAARNAGLDEARGEFIVFVDSDDYVVPEFFSILDKAVEADSSDLAQFSVCIDTGKRKLKRQRKRMSAHSRDELFPLIIDSICRKTINGPWAKIYRHDIIEEHHIRFPEGVSVGEDRAFNIVYSFYINSYSVFDKVTYVLNTENKDSLSRMYRDDLRQQLDRANGFIGRELSLLRISDTEKDSYLRAVNFEYVTCIYHDAKEMVGERLNWVKRQKKLYERCKETNKMH